MPLIFKVAFGDCYCLLFKPQNTKLKSFRLVGVLFFAAISLLSPAYYDAHVSYIYIMGVDIPSARRSLSFEYADDTKPIVRA